MFTVKQIKEYLANEATILNEDGEKVDSKRSRVAKKAAVKRDIRNQAGQYEKFEIENATRCESDACECASISSFSPAIGGAQTAAPLGKVEVITIDDIKEFINGK